MLTIDTTNMCSHLQKSSCTNFRYGVKAKAFHH